MYSGGRRRDPNWVDERLAPPEAGGLEKESAALEADKWT
jgi:hypothetical protein